MLEVVSKERPMEISGGYALLEIELPAGFVGKSIAALDIRNRFDVQIILIRSTDKITEHDKDLEGFLPYPKYVFKPGDRLLVMGKKADGLGSPLHGRLYGKPSGEPPFRKGMDVCRASNSSRHPSRLA